MPRMVPVTYYPVAMQKRLAEARLAVAGSEYEEFFQTELSVPEEVAVRLQNGPMPVLHATPPTAEGLNNLLDGVFDGEDCGYCVLEGPTLYVQSKVSFPGSTPDMFKWWFWWHALDPRRYMLWFPHSHISATVEDPDRLANENLSFEERFYDNPNHVVELMGPEHFESTIRFCPPADLGFDPAKFSKAGYEASASGILEFPGIPHVTNGMMVHIVRPVEGGMELISRYWVGSHPALSRFPGEGKAAEIFADVGMTAEKMELVAYELAVHDMTEWNHLARILPGLYRKFA